MNRAAEMIINGSFVDALISAERSPEIADSDDVYGWLVGSWELEVKHYVVDVRERHIKGEVHFAWVLEGRAMQDLWIFPARNKRPPAKDDIVNSYGMTLRIWDPGIRAWRVTWNNPVTGRRDELVGRRQGKDIVQIGTRSDATPIRWIFSEITPESFRWTGESLNPDGETWKLEGEFLAKRIRAGERR
jgi:hypothetical protein